MRPPIAHSTIVFSLLLACNEVGLDGDTRRPSSPIEDTEPYPPTEAGSWSIINQLECGQLQSANLINVFTGTYNFWILEANDQDISCEQWSEFYTQWGADLAFLNDTLADTTTTVEEQCLALKQFNENIATEVEVLAPPGSCTLNMSFGEEPSGELDNMLVGATVQKYNQNIWAAQADALGDCTGYANYSEVVDDLLAIEGALLESGSLQRFYPSREGVLTAHPSDRGLLLEGHDWPMKDGAENIRLTFSADAAVCEAGLIPEQ